MILAGGLVDSKYVYYKGVGLAIFYFYSLGAFWAGVEIYIYMPWIYILPLRVDRK
jgi:hypothetical protein